MIAVRLQFAQSSVREAARRGKGGCWGILFASPRCSSWPAARSQELNLFALPPREKAEVAARGTKLNRSRQQTRFIFTEGKAISICRLRVRARKLIVSSVLRRHGHIHTLSYSSCRPAEAGLELEAEEADSSGHERTSALEDD